MMLIRVPLQSVAAVAAATVPASPSHHRMFTAAYIDTAAPADTTAAADRSSASASLKVSNNYCHQGLFVGLGLSQRRNLS